MKKQTLIHGLIYGLCGGLLIAALKVIEYRYVVVEHSIEIYGGLTALVFASEATVQEMKNMKTMLDNPLINAALTFIEPFPVA